jgi:dihydroneopterin aldolase
MFDLIRISELEAWAVIGVSDEERAHRQRLLITLDLRVKDIGPAAYTDSVKMTVDYSVVAQRVHAVAESRPRHLIETLAEEIATDLLKAFPIAELKLEIKKFVLPDAQHVAVVIERPKAGRDPSAYRPNPTQSLRMARDPRLGS